MGVPAELAAGMKRLFEFLGDATSDAESFAQQARDDAKRHRVQPADRGEAAAAATTAAEVCSVRSAACKRMTARARA